MGKLNVYDMSEKGVNVSRSPLHLEDGELVKAQNFQTDPTLADGCIRRRDGVGKLNSTALAGSVKGLIALPYPDEFTIVRTFYAPIDDATTDTWRTSTDGTTWATITDATLRKAQSNARSPGAGGLFGDLWRGGHIWANHNHKIYFPGNDYNSPDEAGTNTPPTLYSWDGTTATFLTYIPPAGPAESNTATGITAIVPYSETELIIGVSAENPAGSIHYATILLYDLVTGHLEQLGAVVETNGSALAVFVYQGRIWVAPAEFSSATYNISWIRPGDSDWTVDAAMPAADIGGIGMAEFLGDLYLGTHSSAATDPLIRKRTAATTAWSTVYTGDGSGANQSLGPLIVTADGLTLLAYFNNGNGTAPAQRIMSTTDGTSWVEDEDLVALLGASRVIAGVPYLDSDGSIYWTFRTGADVGQIAKRTSAGAWSVVDTFTGFRGPILALRVPTP